MTRRRIAEFDDALHAVLDRVSSSSQVRIANTLLHMNITTAKQLRDVKPDELLKQKSIGRESILHLRYAGAWDEPTPRSIEQPLPRPNDSVAILDLVVEDIRQRDAIGVQRYGTRLQANNGRDALRDAYEEALDLAFYLKQALVERDEANERRSRCTGSLVHDEFSACPSCDTRSYP